MRSHIQSHIQLARIEWNNCFIKFGSLLGNYSLILLGFNFTKRPEVNVAKKQQVGNHMTCASFVDLNS